MDGLLIYFVGYIGALLVLLSITAVIWVWSKTQSQLLRYGVILLLVLIVLLVVGIGWAGRITTTPPLPMTSTPIATNVLFHSISHKWRPV